MTEPGGALVPLPPLDETGRASFVHGDRTFAVFRLAGRIVVLDGSCPHRGGPLVEGLVRDGGVVCPWHWYTFDLATGQCRNADHPPARQYEVVERDGIPHARIPPTPATSWAQRLRAHAQARDTDTDTDTDRRHGG